MNAVSANTTNASSRQRRFQSQARSPITSVSDEAWARFVTAADVQRTNAVSESGGFGSYDMRPRRLVELGLATDLGHVTAETGRYSHTCVFVPPLTRERFLADPVIQYNVFVRSISVYHDDVRSGKIVVPRGVSLAGALAILHRGGTGALAAWPDLFERTRALYEAAEGAF